MAKKTLPLLLLTGPVGIGKSSVGLAVSQILSTQNILHALVDLDHLRNVFPARKSDPFNEKIGQQNLAAVWKNYKKIGVSCLIVPTVIDRQETIEDFYKSVPGANLFIARLYAPIPTIHSRLRSRETDELEWYLNRAVELVEIFEKNQFENVAVNAGDRIIADIAQEIVEHWNPLGLIATKR